MSRNTYNENLYLEIDPDTGIQRTRAKHIVQVNRSRAKKHGLEYTLTADEWIAKLIASKGCCAYCGTCVGLNTLTLEHVVPISQGGGTTRENVVPACKSCDSKKQTTALTFRSERKQTYTVRTDDQLIDTIETLSLEYGQSELLDTILTIVRLHKEQSRAH